MEKETFYLLCFDSTQKAIYTQKKLSAHILGLRLIPIPPEISAGCGLGLKIGLEYFDAIKEGVLEEDIYIIEKEGNLRRVKKMEQE